MVEIIIEYNYKIRKNGENVTSTRNSYVLYVHIIYIIYIYLETDLATWACAVIGNQTSELLLHWMTLNQLSLTC